MSLQTLPGDVVVQNQHQVPMAIVEVKPRSLTTEVATAIRRNLFGRKEFPPSVVYFLLVSPETGFLWDLKKSTGAGDPPTFQFSMKEVVDRYRADDWEPLTYVDLEYIVFQWLLEDTWSNGTAPGEPERSLVPTGFLDILQGATIAFTRQS